MFLRFAAGGFDNYHEHEILEQLLFEVLPRRNTNEIAHVLIVRFGSLGGVFSASRAELLSVRGVGARTADFLRSVWPETEKRFAESLVGEIPSAYTLAVLRDYFLRVRGLDAAAVLLDGEERFLGFYTSGGPMPGECRRAVVFSASEEAERALAKELSRAGIACGGR